MTTPRILLVDDEPHVLRALERGLEEFYDVTTAVGPFEGLAAIEHHPPFQVVVADMRMPGMDGVQFLAAVAQSCPISVRMMLTGNSDQATAASAVNDGKVFRFLNKPADTNRLRRAIDDCLEQYRLMHAEKELLEQTLSGSIRVLVEILGTVNPAMFGRAQQLKAQAAKLAEVLDPANAWQTELAAMLSQIGAVALPPSLAHKERTSARLPDFEANLVARVPIIGASLIGNIPRLEAVAVAVRYQDQNIDGTGVPGDGTSGSQIPMSARILKVLKEFNALRESGRSATASLNIMRGREGRYDLDVLHAAGMLFDADFTEPTGTRTKVEQLRAGDTLGSDLFTADGILLVGRGQTITEAALARVSAYIDLRLVKRTDTVYVVAPPARAA